MKDKNGVEIRVGDTVQITGAYFKTDNGLYFVAHSSEVPGYRGSDLCLHRLCKSGSLAISKNITNFWPIHSYTNNYAKNVEAKQWNAANAKIEVVGIKNVHGIIEYFNKECIMIHDRLEDNIYYDEANRELEQRKYNFYRGVVNRLMRSGADCAAPKMSDKKKGIKFYYNGIKVDGGNIIRCWYRYSDDKSPIQLHAKDYDGHIPTELDPTNGSDSMTDYFETDECVIPVTSPYYKDALKAAQNAAYRDAKSALRSIDMSYRDLSMIRYRNAVVCIRTHGVVPCVSNIADPYKGIDEWRRCACEVYKVYNDNNIAYPCLIADLSCVFTSSREAFDTYRMFQNDTMDEFEQGFLDVVKDNLDHIENVAIRAELLDLLRKHGMLCSRNDLRL